MSGWSYPKKRIKRDSKHNEIKNQMFIPSGNNQSYGDSNFVMGGEELKSTTEVFKVDLQKESLIASAGYTILETQKLLSNYNLSLPVIPGTAKATLGGCIASDIHGKNSHIYGSFGNHLRAIQLESNGLKTWISPNDTRLWVATIGGQGLTGRINKLEISLLPAHGINLETQIIFTESINIFFQEFLIQSKKYSYCVGWIGSSLFNKELQGYVHVANESVNEESEVNYPNQKNLIKSWMPRIKLMNRYIFCLFNTYQVYFAKKNSRKLIKIARHKYFFPNFNLGNWNYLFGKNGFHELQFFLPFGEENLAIKIIELAHAEQDVFLIGVKIMKGPQIGILSFSSDGWSIAIDFPATGKTPSEILKYYDLITSSPEGRIYLTKDWVLPKEYLNKMYPKHTDLIRIREDLGIRKSVNSEMSLRLDL